MSALLSPINFADTLELWRALPSISFEGKDINMKNIKDNMELIFLITVFVSSLSAITPIS